MVGEYRPGAPFFSQEFNLYEQLSPEAKSIVQESLEVTRKIIYPHGYLAWNEKKHRPVFKNKLAAVEALLQEAIFTNSYFYPDPGKDIECVAMTQIPEKLYREVMDYLSSQRRNSIIEIFGNAPTDNLVYFEGVLINEAERIIAGEVKIRSKKNGLIAHEVGNLITNHLNFTMRGLSKEDARSKNEDWNKRATNTIESRTIFSGEEFDSSEKSA
ncbi:MAG: hypothetical protein Q8P80_03185 [Candidatus Levybacteria bacterium]|nr:hypothetical protein [Candidatus Levybacteria bacterium]